MRRVWMSTSMVIRLVAFLVLALVNTAVAQSEPLALFTITPDDPEAGQNVLFVSSFSRVPGGTGAEVLLHTWDFGDGSDLVATNGEDVSHPYLNPGLFTIRLEVRDQAALELVGVTERTIVVVAAGDAGGDGVNLLPTAEFTMSTTQSAIGDEVSFDASDSSDEDGIKECSTSGAACVSDADCAGSESCLETLQYAWDFGDGATKNFTTDPKAAHTYTVAQKFEVRLFVCDQTTCDADTVVSETFQQIEVLAAGSNLSPTAIVASGPRIATVGESLSFDGQLSFDPNGDLLDFVWKVRSDDFVIDTVLTAVMTRVFDQVGTFEITLEVFDGRGGTDQAEPFTVVVALAPPVIEPPATNPNPGSTLEDPVDSALQRPTAVVCGMGMIPAMFATMLGMFVMAVTRRGLGR